MTMLPALVSAPTMRDSTRIPYEPLPPTLIAPVVVTLLDVTELLMTSPVKVPRPLTLMPEMKALAVVAVLFSGPTAVMTPRFVIELVMLLAAPFWVVVARMPLALVASELVIVPLLETVWLLLIVTAAGSVVTPTDAPLEMVMLPGPV